MNKTEIVTMLKKQCTCYFDAEDQELWKCTPCYARDYIELLASRLEEIGCEHCDKSVKELLK